MPVAEAIRLIFENLSLSNEKLLAACLHDGTHNQNESVNSLIWQCATKETHSSLPTIQLATYLAIGYFIEGAQTLCNVLAALGIVPGRFSEDLAVKSDQEWVYHSTLKSSVKAKKRRRDIRNKKKGYCEAQ